MSTKGVQKFCRRSGKKEKEEGKEREKGRTKRFENRRRNRWIYKPPDWEPLLEQPWLKLSNPRPSYTLVPTQARISPTPLGGACTVQCTPMRAQLPFPSILRPPPVPPLPSPSLSRPGHPSFSRPSFFLHPARLPPQLPLSPRFPRVFLPLYFSPRSRFSSSFCSSLSLGLSIRVYALFTRRFLSRSFLDRRQLLSLSPSRSISVVTPDLSLFLSLFLSVCHSRCISTLPPMRIGSPFFEFRGTTHAWYRHRRGTFLDFRLRLRWTGRERGINARPRSIFRHPSPGRPRRCVEWFVSSG